MTQHNFDGVTADSRKRIEQADTDRNRMPFSGHPQCAFCARRYEHTHVTRPQVRMAEYPGYDPT